MNDIKEEQGLRAAQMTEALLRRMGAGAALASLAARVVGSQEGGNVCLALSPEEEALAAASPLVGTPDRPDRSLLILDGGLLYARRNWLYERDIRKWIGVQAGTEAEVPEPPSEEALAGLNARQKEAVRMMLRERFSILTGGPGTGKTFTIARAVTLMRGRRGGGALRLGLAAPTGKAAARVKDSMKAALAGAEGAPALDATTIHALLKPGRDGVTFHHDAANPLGLDWLVVDEASMIDLPLMARLVAALKPGCRLTLVGDACQLASVEPGRVFADLCRMEGVPKCELVESRRFASDGEVARLAAAVNEGRAEEAVALLKACAAEIHYVPLSPQAAFEPEAWPGFRKRLVEGFAPLAGAATPQEALAEAVLNNCRLLCAFREGPYGVRRLNDIVRRWLGEGCPQLVMVTRNDGALGVYNGDVGVVMPSCPGQLWLPGREAPVPMALLPGWEPAFASTVHKSQGSEFKQVIMVLPPVPREGEGGGLLTREILYTGLTRTFGEVWLYGGDETIRACCRRHVSRQTGFAPRAS